MLMKLPYPISTNRYWRTFRNRQVLSREAHHYKQEVALLAKGAGCVKLDGEVQIWLRVAPKMNQDGSADKRLLDLDNCLKVVIDALQGVAYDNDKQIKYIVADYAIEPEPDGAVFVRVARYE